jgi:ACS family tartrate transporter-like MFS transporter
VLGKQSLEIGQQEHMRGEMQGLDPETSTMRQVSVRLLPLLLGLYLFNYIDRTNVGIAALQMNADLEFGAATFGFGAGIFFLGYALFEVPSNLILARVGARRWLARIGITWGLLTCAMLFVRTPMQFYVARFSLGVAEAGLFPGVIYYLSHWFPESHRARALSGFAIALPIAQVVGGPIGGALLSLRGTAGLEGWQWLFLLEGLPPIVLGGIALYWLKERPAEATWLTAPQRDWLTKRIEDEAKSIGGEDASALRALANPLAWALTVPWFTYYTTALAYVLWVPTIVRESLHTSDVVTGLVVGGVALGGAIAYPLAAILSDRWGERCYVAALGMTCGTIGCVGVALLVGSPLRFAPLTGCAIMGAFVLPSFWCLPTRFVRGPSAAATIALINAVGSSGGFFGPSLVGLFRKFGGDTGAFYALAALSLVGCAAFLALRRLRTFQRTVATADPKRNRVEVTA